MPALAPAQQLPSWFDEVLREASRSVGPLAVLVVGLIFGFLAGRIVRRVLVGLGVPSAVEGTAFERSTGRLGTSTVSLVSTIVTLFIYVVTVGMTLELAGLLDTALFVPGVTGYLREVFIAVFIVIAGLVVGDVAELAARERTKGVKLPEVNVIPVLVKYSVFYVTALLALAQLGVAIGALLILLAGYAFALVFLGGLALRDLLRAGAAGIYLLLAQPYGIGDRVEVDGHRGIVQEVDVLVTRVESEEEELIVPNHLVFESGVVRVRS
jgi:hypothetical protein